MNHAPIPDPRMGDDGTGHCRGCGCTIDTFTFDCAVCLYALDVIGGAVRPLALAGAPSEPDAQEIESIQAEYDALD
jgi:hypothetical protein